MNREQVKKLLPVFKAFSEGKDVQFRNPEGRVNSGWINDDEMNHFEIYEYRIKPEPREFWVALNSNGSIFYCSHDFNDSNDETVETIKVREVLDDE